MGRPLSPSFTISAADISKTVSGWESDPVKTVDNLKEHARALKVFKKDNPQIQDPAAETAFRALTEACERIGKIINDKAMPFRTNLQVAWHYGVWLSHMGRNQEALLFMIEARSLCPESDKKMNEKIASKTVHITQLLHQGSPQLVCDLPPLAECTRLCRVAENLDKEKRFADSAKVFEQAIKLAQETNPPGFNLDYPLRRAAEIYCRHLHQPKTALAYAKKAYEIDPDNPRNMEEYGLIECYFNHYKNGAELLKKAIESKPILPQKTVVMRLIEALCFLGQYDEALAYLEKSKKNPKIDDLSRLQKLLYIHRRAGSCKETILQIAEQLEKHHDLNHDIRAIRELGMFFFDVHNYKKAKIYLDMTYREFPKDTDLVDKVATCYRMTGCNKEAKKFIEKSLQGAPLDRDVLLAAAHQAVHDSDIHQAESYRDYLQKRHEKSHWPALDDLNKKIDELRIRCGQPQPST